MEDLYSILGCNESSSQSELKKAYQTLALQFHPDKAKSNDVSGSEKFIKVNHAWKILGDPAVREQYDVRWRERCLAQAYPIQDTVDFDEFEIEETDSPSVIESNCDQNIAQSGKNIGDGDILSNLNTEEVKVKSNQVCSEKSADVSEEPYIAEADHIYTYSCRCGGCYLLTEVDVKLKFDIVCCDSCSLSIQVVYDMKDD